MSGSRPGRHARGPAPAAAGPAPLVPLIALVMVAALVLAGCRGDGAGPDGDEAAPAAGRTASFDLYFPGEGGHLYAEERELEVTGEPRNRARAIVLALLDGPRSPALQRPFPESVGLLDLYFQPDGTVYVDLGAEDQDTPPPGGSLAEMMRVYSVVDSIVFNVPEARRVALLWNGVQRESFSGHLDTSVALEADASLLAPAERAERGAEEER